MMPLLFGRDQFESWLEKRRISFEGEDAGVRSVLSAVRNRGDEAVSEYTLKFDGVKLEKFEVDQREITEAIQQVPDQVIQALTRAKENIADYHRRQKTESWGYEKNGAYLGQLVRPLDRVGLYVPGGKGIYPSTVLMTAVPAEIAGVKEIIMITPPGKEGKIHPVLAAAAKVCGVKRIFKAGGVQGVAALAYGTKQFPKVDKIVGPGNQYVTFAKKYLYGTIDIDSLAGPSEVMILADENSSETYLTADLFAQAEHSEDAQSILLVPSEEKARKVIRQIETELENSPRKQVLKSSIQENSCAVVYYHLEEAFDLINYYAPEHLQIFPEYFTNDEIAEKVHHAGAIFIGPNTPVALGDYYAGTNHTLPTSGTARYASPLGVYDFVKLTSVLRYPRDLILKQKEEIALIAELEGFYEHARSVKIRE